MVAFSSESFFPLVTPRSNCEEPYFRSVHSQSSGGEFEMLTPPLPQRESDQLSAHLGSATLGRSGQTHPFLCRANILEDESIIPGCSERLSDSGWPAKYQTGERSPAARDSKFQDPTKAAEIACCSGFSAAEKGGCLLRHWREPMRLPEMPETGYVSARTHTRGQA